MHGRERLVHVITELSLRQAVSYTHLLFLQHLLAVFASPPAATLLVLRGAIGRERKLLRLRFFKDRCAEALRYFISWSCDHKFLSHSPRLRWTWAIVRNWCHVFNGFYLNTFSRKRAKNRLASCAYALDDDCCFFEPDHHPLFAEELADLCRSIGRGLPRAREAECAGA